MHRFPFLRGGIAAAVVTALLASLPGAARATELVRVLVSQFDGTEPASISSATHPDLFVLDAAIASAELTATNPLGEFKTDDGPASWFPSLAPTPPAEVAGRIELSIAPVAGSPVSFGAIRFRTAALFDSNPSSFVLQWSEDGFADPLLLIDLSAAATATVGVTAPADDQPTIFRWLAGNAFGENGGGQAGFTGEDVVVFSSLCDATPRSGCAAPGASNLKLLAPDDAAKRKLFWSWREGTASSAQFGNPTATTIFALCLYDDGALVLPAIVAPEDVCGKKPCWKPLKNGSGFTYGRAKNQANGIAAMKLQEGDGKARISVVGVGQNLGLPESIAQTSDVTVQLVRSDGADCFESVFTAPASKNEPGKFIDKIG
jgi:hypothetical protein